jgi:colanic acid biosynthesis glycosyl transferase WcaI
VKLIFLNRYFHPDISATSQMLSGLAFHLAARGAEVHVITSRQRYEDPAAELPKSELIAGVCVHRVISTQFGRRVLFARALDYASFYASAAFRLAELAGRGDIIIAKTDPPLISVPAALVASLRGARLVNWVQDLFPEIAERTGIRLPLASYAIRGARNRSLRRAALNVVPGERMRTAVQAVAGAATTTVIHNWADGNLVFPLDSHANPLRTEWGLIEKFVVSYSGNMGRAHEFGTILDAAEALRDQARIVFLFIGGGHHLDALQKRVSAGSLRNVLFRPYQPQARLSQSLGVADLHLTALLPELEGLVVPSKIYGILAAGRPTLHVGDPEGEIAAILNAADAGFSVATGQANLLAEKILELSSAPARARNLGSNARRAFDEKYSDAIAYDKWDRALKELAPGPKA